MLFVIWDLGFGIWDLGFVIWDLLFGLVRLSFFESDGSPTAILLLLVGNGSIGVREPRLQCAPMSLVVINIGLAVFGSFLYVKCSLFNEIGRN